MTTNEQEVVAELLREGKVLGGARKRLGADIVADKAEIRGKYKIEIRFGPDRTGSELRPSTGAITIWESGQHLHGGGDDQMTWCGYPDCDKPISSSDFGLYHVVCPHCRRENFIDEISKAGHIQHLKDEHRHSPGIEKLPCTMNTRGFRLPPSKLAQLMVKIFRSLDSNADIYLKYHTRPIRFDKGDIKKAATLQHLCESRLSKRPVIYPLKNILKDTAAGADVYQRFLALLKA